MAKPKKKPTKKSKAKTSIPAPVEKRGRGRPTDYKPEYAEQAYKFYLLGATDAEMADFFGVTEQTVNNWKERYEDFFASTQRGKLLADAEVAFSLYNRAKGFEVEVEKEVGRGEEKRILKRKVRVEADPNSAQHWLKNRRPKQWRDIKQVEFGGPGDFDSMTPDELIRHIAEEDQALAALGLYDAVPGSDSVN